MSLRRYVSWSDKGLLPAPSANRPLEQNLCLPSAASRHRAAVSVQAYQIAFVSRSPLAHGWHVKLAMDRAASVQHVVSEPSVLLAITRD